jgi:hypothetical protein
MSIAQNYPEIRPSLNLDFANTKKLDPRVTFARASSARFYDGRSVAKAEENLLINSQSFGAGGWSLADGATLGSTVTAPDGTSTARELSLLSVDTSRLSQTVQVTNGLDYTFSVFMRVASGSVSVKIGSIVGGVFESKTVTTTWTRFSITSTANTTGARFPQITRDGTDTTIEIWGAQLEQRSAPTAYIATTTQPITNYIPVLQTAANNVARFDHNPITGESLGLLVEEQRTNLVTYSEAFDDAAWNKLECSIASNIIIAPNGTLTGDKLVETNGASVSPRMNNSISATEQSYTASVYLKAGERRYAQLLARRDGSNFNGVLVDLLNGTLSAPTRAGTTSNVSTSTITAVGNNWYRVAMTYTYTTTGTTIVTITTGSDSAGAWPYTGDGFSGIYIWGAQLEASSTPSSYIKTEASQVTRSADVASMTGNNFLSWYRQDQGTLYVEAAQAKGGSPSLFAVDDTTASNRIIAFCPSQTSAGYRVVSSGTNQANINVGSIALQANFKLAFGYEVNNFAGSLNGSAVVADTSGVVPSNISAARIGTNVASVNALNGTIKKLSYYPARLTDTQLQALTS